MWAIRPDVQLSLCFQWTLILQPPSTNNHLWKPKSEEADHSHCRLIPGFMTTRFVILSFPRWLACSKATTSTKTIRWGWWLSSANPSFFYQKGKPSLLLALRTEKNKPRCLLLCIIFLPIKREQTLKQRWIQRVSGKLSRKAPKDTSPRGRHKSSIYYLVNVQAYAGFQTRLQFKNSITGWAAASWVL